MLLDLTQLLLSTFSSIDRSWFLIFFFIISHLIIYQCVLKYWHYFQQQNIKFVRGMPLLGAMWKVGFGLDTYPSSILSIYNRFPNEKIFGFFYVGGTPKYLIRDPEMIKQIFIKNYDHFLNRSFFIDPDIDPMLGRSLVCLRDEKWKNMRSIISSVLKSKNITLLFSAISHASEQFCSYITNNLSNKSGDCEMKELFSRFANDSIASCLFAVNVNSMKDPNNLFYKTGNSITNYSNVLKKIKFLLVYSLPIPVAKLLKISIFNEQDTLLYFRNIFHENIRKRNDIKRNNLIDVLIKAKSDMENDVDKEMKNNMAYDKKN